MSRYIFIPLCLLTVSVVFVCSSLPTQTEDEPAEGEIQEPVVHSKDPKITYSKEKTVKSGETVLLDCSVKNVDLSRLEDFKILWGKVEEATADKPEKLMKISSNTDIVLFSEKYKVIHPKDTYQYSLQLTNVNEKDTGVYRCTVFFGKEQKINADVPLLVQKPAYFSDETIKTIKVAEGDAIAIDCQPGGSPTPTVYWERVGQDLPHYGGKYFVANQFELPLIQRSHQGHYLCYADNGLGKPATSEVYIEVDYKPSIVINKTKVAASVYQKVELKCVVDAVPEAKAEWRRNGKRVTPSANVIIDTQTDKETTNVILLLTILQIQVEEFSEYSCVAENEVGVSEKIVRVELKTPPTIEKQTEGEKIYELDENSRGRNELPIALECVGSGVPAPSYRWTKDKKILDWKSDPRMSLEPGTGTLLIKDPDIKDNGIYQCFAYNELGLAASDKMKLINNTVIGFIREEPGEVHYEAEIGRPFRLDCPKVVGHPKPELTWMKARDIVDGIEMEYINNDRMVIDEKGTLWVTHITSEDDTEKNNFKFTCLATSELHPYDISLAKTITVKTIPPADGNLNLEDEYINIESFLMHSSPKEVIFRSGEDNKLWCIFGGEPLPEVIWERKDGINITDEKKYLRQNNGQTLVFVNTQLGHAGEYECLATNGIGNMKKFTINVTVEVVPKFTSDFKEQARVVHQGTSVTFACGILEDKVAQPKYEWFFNSRPVKVVPGSRKKIEGSNLIITSSTVADTGNYACKASNDVGYAYGQTTLTVIPKSPSHAEAAATVNDQTLEDIKKEIQSLTTDIQKLKEIVQTQSKENKLQQNIADLLSKIAEKVLSTNETTATVSPEEEVN